MPHEQLTIDAPDGAMPLHLFTPDGEGPWPAVIIYMDALGVRASLAGIGERLAASGYLSLLPDLFYRAGPYGPLDPKEVFGSPEGRKAIGPLMASTGNDKAAADTGAVLAWLDTRRDVAGRRVGAVGFCMGGGMAIAAAGTYPDRFAAVASFHGGRLATDQPTSPHLLAPQIEAELYIAAASDDASYPPDMAERFEHALDEADVTYRAETYPAKHGWMKPDFPVYDADQAERGWREMLALFERTLAA